MGGQCLCTYSWDSLGTIHTRLVQWEVGSATTQRQNGSDTGVISVCSSQMELVSRRASLNKKYTQKKSFYMHYMGEFFFEWASMGS